MSTIALIAWPLIAVLIAQNSNNNKAALAIITVLPYLFLPQIHRIDLPGLPDLSKDFSITIGLLAAVLFLTYNSQHRSGKAAKETSAKPSTDKITMLLFIFLLLSTIFTWRANLFSVPIGNSALPSLGPRDVINMSSALVISLVPYFVARRFLSDAESHATILKVFVVLGLMYSVLMLVELRLSPQLHRWVYGTHSAENFAQHIRGGYRPMVFLGHGLQVGFFTLACVISAGGLYKGGHGKKWLIALAWLLLVLLLSKNLGATIICLATVIIQFLFTRRLQLLIAAIVSILLLTYPATRSLMEQPLHGFTNLIENYSPSRAQSFEFRLDNEDILLRRAMEKPFAGWGGWDRNRVFDETGKDITVIDGYWIALFGIHGWAGYLSFFGLLTIPTLRLFQTRKVKVPDETMAILLVTSCNLVYMIPNGTLTPAGLLMFGALAGSSVHSRVPSVNVDVENEQLGARTREPRKYTRF